MLDAVPVLSGADMMIICRGATSKVLASRQTVFKLFISRATFSELMAPNTVDKGQRRIKDVRRYAPSDHRRVDLGETYRVVRPGVMVARK